MMNNRIDLTGQSFGDLTVINLSKKRGKDGTRLWKCKCSCGNVMYLYSYSLRHGHYKSCGCKRVDKRGAGLERHIQSDRVDGTRKSALKSKLHKRNKSGHKGVAWIESRKKWRAYIGYKGKQIALGYFDNKEDAISARLKAEEKYYKPILEEKDND